MKRSDPRRAYAEALISRMGEITGDGPCKIVIAGLLTEAAGDMIRRKIAAAHARGNPEIQLRITDSPGGADRAGLAIARDLRSVNIPSTAHVDRYCASATIAPFLAAAARSCGVNANFFLHRAALLDVGERLDAPRLRLLAAQLESSDQEFFGLVAARCGRLPPHLDLRMRGRGLHLSAVEACAHGLVDEVRGLYGAGRRLHARARSR